MPKPRSFALEEEGGRPAQGPEGWRCARRVKGLLSLLPTCRILSQVYSTLMVDAEAGVNNSVGRGKSRVEAPQNVPPEENDGVQLMDSPPWKMRGLGEKEAEVTIETTPLVRCATEVNLA